MSLSKLVVAAAGNLGIYKHEELDSLVTENGGQFSKIVDNTVTHLVCSAYAYRSRSQKVESAIDMESIMIVDVWWIEDSIGVGYALPETKYLFGKKNHPAREPEEKKDKKRALNEGYVEWGTQVDDPHTTQLRTKRICGDIAVVSDSNVGGCPGKVVEGIKKALKSGKIIKFGLGWISETSVHVYRDEKETLYEEWLGRTDVKRASAEILVFKILESNTKPLQYALCCSESNGARKAIYGHSFSGSVQGLGELINVYKSELEKRILRGYLRIGLDYSIERQTLEAAPSKRTLETRSALYGLLDLISSPKPNVTPKEMTARTAGYDELIVKNISRATIEKGKKILAMLEKSIGNPPKKSSKSEQTSIKKGKLENEGDLVKLTSNYYSYIPHIFAENSPITPLDSHEKIGKEVNILENLEAIRDSAILAKKINLQDNGHDDTLEEHFKSLNLKKIDFVGEDSKEFELIKRYFVNTGGCDFFGDATSCTLQLFRIERFDDEEQWNEAGWDQKMGEDDNRRLLWHGTPLKNIHMILKEGLQDVSRADGIYFSDTAQTSIDYCQPNEYCVTPLAILLCEVQLGHMSRYSVRRGDSTGEFGIQRGKIDYKWSDAGVINENLKGVRMPVVKEPNSLPYEHVEWVAHLNPSQIKHRYLVIYHHKTPELEAEE